MISVVTWFWRDPARDNRGYTFDAEHVRILKRMVDRNLSLPHRFICVTDETIDGIDCVPLNWTKHVPGTVFMRLAQHDPEWAGKNLGSRILSLDIDVVITGSLDAICARTEPIVLWHNPNFGKPQRAFYQSSIQLFSVGARPELYWDFDPNQSPRWVNWRFGGREQAWISEKLDWNEAYFDANHGIYGARHLDGLPANARIVSFPGARAPWQAEVQQKHKWIVEHYR